MARLREVGKWAGIIVAAVVILGCIAPYAVPVAKYDPAAVNSPFKNGRFTGVDGVRLHYRYWEPTAEPAKGNVVLIHGFCGSTFSWRKNIDAIRNAGYRITALDLPAFGYSDRIHGIYQSPRERAKMVWDFLSTIEKRHFPKTEHPKWVLVGHSMGGGVIAAMAQVAPERTDSLIFVDGAVFNHGGQASTGSGLARGAMDSVLSFPPVVRWVEVIAKYRLFTQDHIKGLLTSAYAQPADDDAVKGYLAALQVPGTARAVLAHMRDMGKPDGLDASTIQAPCLLIWGDEDTWVPLRAGERLRDTLPHAQWHVIPGAGHCSMETHPDAFNSLVVNFLKERAAA